MQSIGGLVLVIGLSSCGDQLSVPPSAESGAPPLAPQSQQSEADQPASGGFRLLGVLTVGTQTRALCTFGTNLGEICVGPRGHCSADHPLVLPEGWSVLTIDDQNGCVQLAENGKAQDLLCIT